MDRARPVRRDGLLFVLVFARSRSARAETTTSGALAIDALLAVQFALLHSALLLPRAQEVDAVDSGAGLWGVLLCGDVRVDVGGDLGLAAVRRSGLGSAWRCEGGDSRGVLRIVGVDLIQSLFVWLRESNRMDELVALGAGRAVPERIFQPRGIYLLLRHPVYLSFLGLVWFVPCMTIDRALLTAVWTVYVFVGSYLKDQRMVHYLGMTYRQYQTEVPGYPGMLVGPLGAIERPELVEESVPAA